MYVMTGPTWLSGQRVHRSSTSEPAVASAWSAAGAEPSAVHGALACVTSGHAGYRTESQMLEARLVSQAQA